MEKPPSHLPGMGPKDPFFIWTGRFLNLVSQNKRFLVIVLVVVLALVTGLMITRFQVEKKWVRLNHEIFEASHSEQASESLSRVIGEWGDEKAMAAKLTLIRLAISKKDFTEALKQIDSVLKLAPVGIQPVLVSSRIQILWQQGKSDDALKAADDFIAMRPIGVASSYVLFTKAEILGSLGKTEEARVIYDQLAKEAGESEIISSLIMARSLGGKP